MNFNIQDKLDFIGELNYQGKQATVPYFSLNIGADKLSDIDTDKHLIKLGLDELDMTDWYQQWHELSPVNNGSGKNQTLFISDLDQVVIDIKHAKLFAQPLSALHINALNDKKKWSAAIESDNLTANVEYRSGMPKRFDFDIKTLNFQTMDLAALNTQQGTESASLIQRSDNLLEDYPEIVAKCSTCIYRDLDFSQLQLHIFPSKSRLNLNYINIGTDNEFTHLSGVWDQRHTNMIVDLVADKNNSIIKRLGFSSPVVFTKAEASGAFNWVGAPWQFNFESLNGAFSSSLEEGSITDVSDKGARLLSIFSLDGIRRSLNLEFNNVFAKGFTFDDFTLSGNITDGIIRNDDFYLNGSAGKIVGNGLIDLPNYETNYKFSYSPAVTSSLPVLTAFAVNPLTGAAVLVMSKLLEPVVETIIRVDFSVTGPLNNPAVKQIKRQKGKVKLQNKDLFEEQN
jgi:uncharacterized protein YhdP